MIHQPLGGAQGQATDIEIQAKEILRIKKEINNILVKHTGQTYDNIEKDTDRDNFMDTTQAKKYGLIDSIITQKDVKELSCSLSDRLFYLVHFVINST